MTSAKRFLKQLMLLSWKNFLAQIRSPIWLLIELIPPILIAIVFCLIRSMSPDSMLSGDKHNGQLSPISINDPWEFGLDSTCQKTAKIIAYAPTNPLTNSLMQKAINKVKGLTVKSYADHTALNKAIEESLRKMKQKNKNVHCEGQEFYAGVLFDFKNGTRKDFQYRLRYANIWTGPQDYAYACTCQPTKAGYQTKNVFPSDKWNNPGPRDDKKINGKRYYDSGFLSLQRAIDIAIMNEISAGKQKDEAKKISSLKVKLAKMPYGDYKTNAIFKGRVYVIIMSIFMVIGLLAGGLYAARTLLSEKESGLKEYMLTMGLSNSCWWISHFIFSFVKQIIALFVIACLLCFWAPLNNQRALPNTSFCLLLWLLVLWSTCIILMAYCAVSIFQKVSRVAIFILLFWLLSLVPSFAVNMDTSNVALTSISCLILNSGLAMGLEIITKLELQSIGLSWTTVADRVTPNTTFSFAHVLVMMHIQCLLYLIIIGLADKDSTLRYFISVAKAKINKHRSGKRITRSSQIRGYDESGSIVITGFKKSRVETMHDKEHEPSIKICNLVKTFSTGFLGRSSFRAVDGLSFDVAQKQLTVLLGHNGAGKSTTFAMLTGSLSPSEGDVKINDFDVGIESDKVRQIMGFCPQHNVLINNLTVTDHLKFFCRLKNRPVDENEIKELLELLSLEDKCNSKAGTLSGGQKRKLSVGIAMIGKSEIILLDEPSSGVDTQTRHEFWKLLQQEKERRTILMTTHYMEEADVLGDRIVIMANGKLHCAGTPSFLKRKYGAGYHLTFAYQLPATDEIINETLLVIKKHTQMSEVELEKTEGVEATFILPYETRSSFPKMFEDLEKRQKKLSIVTFGVSVTTLEEVFLKVGDESKKIDTMPMGPKPINKAKLSVKNRLTGVPLMTQQFLALLTKKGYCWIQGGYSTSIIVSIALVLLAVMLALTYTTDRSAQLMTISQETSLALDTQMFGDQIKITAFYDKSPKSKQYAEKYSDLTGSNILSSESLDIIEYYKNQFKTLGHNKYEQVVIGAEFALSTVVVWYSGEPYHALPVSLNTINNALFQYIMNDAEYKITCINQPYDAIDLRNKSDVNVTAFIVDGLLMPVVALILIIIILADYTARYVSAIAEEAQSGMKHLQYATGVSPLMYWSTHFLFDFTMLMFPALCIFVLFLIFGFHGFSVGVTPLCYWMAIMLFGWAQIPSRYLVTYLVKSPTRALIASVVISVITGVMYLIVFCGFNIFGKIYSLAPDILNDQPDIRKGLLAADITMHIIGSTFSPIFNFGYVLFTVHFLGALRYGCKQWLDIKSEPLTNIRMSDSSLEMLGTLACMNPIQEAQDGTVWGSLRQVVDSSTEVFLGANKYWWTFGIGFELMMMFAQGVVFWAVILAIDYGIFRRIFKRKTTSEGSLSPIEDVADEQKTVQSTNPNHYTIVANALSKSFGKFKAVKNVTFGVRKGECFGLLGVNGAGKTSTFKMLTGELRIPEGQVHINGRSVGANWQKACTAVGYCPQFEAVLQSLTGRHLTRLFGRLRGIPRTDIDEITDNVLEAVDITRYKDRPFQEYSGGTKRRASLGLALIGVPAALMLDEPTTGVDPVARRALWTILSRLKMSDEHKVAILLTSHSMEECDALCDRLAIMMQGQFSCLGSPQYLKSRFGQSLTLNIRLKQLEQMTKIQNDVRSRLPGSVCTQQHHTALTFSVPSHDGQEYRKWSAMFATMEQINDEVHLEDYSLSQATLEDVFLTFTSTANAVNAAYANPMMDVPLDDTDNHVGVTSL